MSGDAEVMDWARDWDHTNPEWVNDPYPIFDELRDRCPVAHTNRFNNGVWLPLSFKGVEQVLKDATTFSSDHDGIQKEGYGRPRLPPIHTDPPDHREFRRILLPEFTPSAAANLRDWTRSYCDGLASELEGRSRCDASVDFAQHVPVAVMARILGVPIEDGGKFRSWIKQVIELGPNDPTISNRAFGELADYMSQVLDVVPPAVSAVVDRIRDGAQGGSPLDRDEQVRMLMLLVIAGVDTVWNTLGAALWHLSTHPSDRERLVQAPDLIPDAVEEFLRLYAPVSVPRRALADAEVEGQAIATGDMLLVCVPAANRDSQAFEDANQFKVDRSPNRHLAFGLGIHRCLGSNLARMELQVALEAWLAAIPNFSLEPAAEVSWSGGVVRGPKSVPLLIGMAGEGGM